MTNLYLYKVTSDVTGEYDTFQSAIVYAESASDAVKVVLETIGDRLNAPDDSGTWAPLASNAQLKAKRVSIRRGPIMADGYPG